MNYCLKSLLLLAALPLCVASTSQEATATDRFDVKVEVLQFQSLLNTSPSGYVVVNYYKLDVDIEGIGRRTINSKIITRPFYMMPVKDKVQFTNIKKPNHKKRHIKLSARMIGHYRLKVNSPIKVQLLGTAKSATTIDLFREADHAKNDTAAQTVLVRNQNYRMIVRVTVIETD
jgi:hypothetical protein